jgi:hypothetical protein
MPSRGRAHWRPGDVWAGKDADTMDEIWEDIIQDLDSVYARYAYVSSVGIGA